MAIPTKAEIWVAFATAAMHSYEEPDKIKDERDLADDMVRVSTEYADLMLKELEKRFDAEGGKKRRRGRSRDDEEEEEDEDEDDDDEDEDEDD